MKFMSWEKDGGPESNCSGLYVVEIKKLFTIVLLKFEGDSREAFHKHAFDCWSWVLGGKHLIEEHKSGRKNMLPHSGGLIDRLIGFGVYRDTYHKVSSKGSTWVFSLRGPWADEWDEYLEDEQRERTLTHGRIEVA